MPSNFMVRSQVPSIFLRTSCSGPGLAGSWARTVGAVSVTARATAQNQRTAFIATLLKQGRPDRRAPHPPAGLPMVWAGPGRDLIGGLYFAPGASGSSVVNQEP